MKPPTKSVSDLFGQDALVDGASRNLPRHRWYSVKESFPPALVEAAIEHEGCGRGDLVLDPFCGGGTVPLVAACKNIDAIGIELNPFLAFVSKAKLVRSSGKGLRTSLPGVVAGIEKGAHSSLKGYSTFSRTLNDERGLFNTEVLEAFEGGWRAVEGLRPQPKRLIRLALIGSAMDQCNAVRDGKALRYRPSLLDARFNAGDFVEAFNRRVLQMADDLEAKAAGRWTSTVWRGDSRTRLSALGERRFRLCVTSPPYLNSFDYSDIYRPELFLGKFVTTNQDLRKLRLRTIRSHVQANWKRPHSTDFGQLFEACWQEITNRVETLWDHRIPLMVQAYFEDMKDVLKKLRSLAAPSASVWLVVSTSAYGGVEVPVDLILADIGTQVGWHLREVYVLRELRSSGQHWKSREHPDPLLRKRPPLRESIIIFDERPKPRGVNLTARPAIGSTR